MLVFKRSFFYNKTRIVGIPESFNTNILYILFDYKIIFVNSHHIPMHSKGYYVVKMILNSFFLQISDIKNKSDSDLVC